MLFYIINNKNVLPVGFSTVFVRILQNCVSEFFGDFLVTYLLQETTFYRRHRERFWIYQLGTIAPLGINVKE